MYHRQQMKLAVTKASHSQPHKNSETPDTNKKVKKIIRLIYVFRFGFSF
jgi:hypothetical protein